MRADLVHIHVDDNFACFSIGVKSGAGEGVDRPPCGDPKQLTVPGDGRVRYSARYGYCMSPPVGSATESLSSTGDSEDGVDSFESLGFELEP